VKSQRVVVRHDKPYRGIWHDEGLHERIAAVVVYYYDVPSTLQGGQMQLASKKSHASDYYGREVSSLSRHVNALPSCANEAVVIDW
jgi:hypothetical protein